MYATPIWSTEKDINITFRVQHKRETCLNTVNQNIIHYYYCIKPDIRIGGGAGVGKCGAGPDLTIRIGHSWVLLKVYTYGVMSDFEQIFLNYVEITSPVQ